MSYRSFDLQNYQPVRSSEDIANRLCVARTCAPVGSALGCAGGCAGGGLYLGNAPGLFIGGAAGGVFGLLCGCCINWNSPALKELAKNDSSCFCLMCTSIGVGFQNAARIIACQPPVEPPEHQVMGR